MKVEILIYAYLAICAAMIVFNIVCIFVFRSKDKNIQRRSKGFTQSIKAQLDAGEVTNGHKKYLQKKLQKINHMMAFDETLEALYREKPEAVQAYIAQLRSVFAFLNGKYRQKDTIKAAYFPYIIQKYHVFKGIYISSVVESLLELVKEPNLYCRENALLALYSIGDGDSVIRALKILDRTRHFHHEQMIIDGLCDFTGDKESFDELLWQSFSGFSLRMKQPILDYFRFSSSRHCERMLQILTDPEAPDPLRFSAIRYFAEHPYAPALACLYRFAREEYSWVYKTITATALGSYPGDETIAVLKDLLCNEVWYVRYNASESLDRLGVRYEDMIDIFEGKDRYASEMLRYRFDRKKLKEEEPRPV